MLLVRVPQVTSREAKGTQVCSGTSRHSGGQGEGRMLVVLSSRGPVHPRPKFRHLLYPRLPFATELLAAVAGGWFLPLGLHSKPWAGAGTALQSRLSG